MGCYLLSHVAQAITKEEDTETMKKKGHNIADNMLGCYLLVVLTLKRKKKAPKKNCLLKIDLKNTN